jgi:ligand-binding SRPBCC domain-containing protein
MARISLSCTVDAPVEVVFAFHLDTRNVARISPRGTRVLAVDGPVPVAEGDEVQLEIRQLPLPMRQRWLIRIETVRRPTLVVDRMVEGPFRRWRHEHRFTSLGAGQTLVTDDIEYALPFGPLGRLVDALVVRHVLRFTFRLRHRRTAEVLRGASYERRSA